MNSEAGYIGLGYIDYYIGNAGVTEITAPDETTLVLKTDRPNTQVLQMYIPILPKHVWQDKTLDTVADFTNDVPIVGSGPYQAVEWQKGQYVRFVKNPNWTGPELAADEVFIQIFKNADTQYQAFRSGELDYAGVNGDQFAALQGEPNVVTVAGTGNGFTELGFNSYSKPIEGGGASTKALQDPAFRDAIGYAIDKDLVVERAIKGFGEVGTTFIPPFQTKWHVEPTALRTFDIELAKQKLDAAGYVLDGEGRRLDKEGKALNLRLYMPDSAEFYSTSAQFVQDWLSQLGIKVTTQVFDSGTLTSLMLPPEAGDPANKADYDLFIWGWGGDVDPNSLLKIFLCSSIGSQSDSMYCNPRYDELFDLQNRATSDEERKGHIAEMQQMIYADAPYHVLFYDASTIAYRTDRFTGWKNQPASNGVPFFGYGSYGYWQIKAVSAETPAPSASAGPVASGEPTPAPSGDGSTGGSGSDNALLLAAGAVAVVVLIVAIFLVRRRSGGPTEEE